MATVNCARIFGVDIFVAEGNKKKRILKIDLLVELCPTCGTLEDVQAMGGEAMEGIAGRWWNPAIDNAELSICNAFHFSMIRASDSWDPEGGGQDASFELNRFRAHLLSHLVVNYDYYVIKGRSNLVQSFSFSSANVFHACFSHPCVPTGPGSIVVCDPDEKLVNFAAAVASMWKNHYHGRHVVQYCGQLRTTDAGACVPFQQFQLCDARVASACRACLKLVVDFVATAQGVVALDLPPAHQAELRAHFGLAQQIN